MAMIRSGLLIFVMLISTGCVSVQEPISMEKSFADNIERVLIVMEPVPEPNTYFPGADCLLCLATANTLHTSLNSHVKTLDATPLTELANQIAEVLRERKVDVTVLDRTITVRELPKYSGSAENSAKRDFSALALEHNATHVMVISVIQVGFSREFASYIPTNTPVAIVKGTGYLVDVRDGIYDWYYPFDVARGVRGEWDQPPNFPDLTNAYFQVLANTKDELLSKF